MADHALTVRLPDVTTAPSPAEWGALRDQAAVIVASGMAPRTVNTAEKVLTIALKGRELRIPPMQALAQIHIVEGKPTLSAELMLALVQRAGHKVRIRETTTERAVVEGVRSDDPDYPTTITWTMDDAKRAGVAGKGPWKQYPDAMLRARAISALCRAMFADVLMGASYTPEELGADVDGDGTVTADPAHTALLEDVEQLLDDLADAHVEVDADKARQYAAISQAHAEKTVQNLTARLPDVVEAEIVEDDEPEAPEAQPDVEVFPWRDRAAALKVNVVDVLSHLRKDWPENSQWNMPSRSKDIDALAADPTMAPIVAAAIEDAKGH